MVNDDDPLRRETVRVLSASFGVLQARDEYTAFQLCLREQVDVLVADFDMAGDGGARLIASLATAFDADAPPAVILTESAALSGISSPGMHVLLKPVTHEALLAALDAALAERRRRKRSGIRSVAPPPPE